jgi:hypothetical protein
MGSWRVGSAPEADHLRCVGHRHRAGAAGSDQPADRQRFRDWLVELGGRRVDLAVEAEYGIGPLTAVMTWCEMGDTWRFARQLGHPADGPRQWRGARRPRGGRDPRLPDPARRRRPGAGPGTQRHRPGLRVRLDRRVGATAYIAYKGVLLSIGPATDDPAAVPAVGARCGRDRSDPTTHRPEDRSAPASGSCAVPCRRRAGYGRGLIRGRASDDHLRVPPRRTTRSSGVASPSCSRPRTTSRRRTARLFASTACSELRDSCEQSMKDSASSAGTDEALSGDPIRRTRRWNARSTGSQERRRRTR